MTPFIDRIIADLAIVDPGEWKDVLFILPSRRAGVILKRNIALQTDRPIVAPEVKTLDAFVGDLVDTDTVGSIELVLEFYRYYCSVTEVPEPFETFIDWAPIFLADMNDIDSYQVHSESLFANMNDAKRMEAWSVDGAALTPTQQQYLDFFDKLSTYYDGFKAYLMGQKRGYSGMVFRSAAELDHALIEQSEWLKSKSTIVFAGFNALKASEWELFKVFQRWENVQFYWDDDDYFHHVKGHEAGEFLRRWKRDWTLDQFSWTDRAFREQGKRVEVVSAPGALTQVRYLANRLAILDRDAWSKSVVILGDESLLIPLLESLPSNAQKLNVTIGYALKNSVIHSFLRSFLKMHLTALNWQMRKGSYRFYHEDVLAFSRHPLFAVVEGSKEIRQKVDKLLFVYQRTFMDGKEIVAEHEPFSKLFSSECASPAGFLSVLVNFFEQVIAKGELNVLSQELAIGALSMLSRVDDLVTKYELDVTLKGLNKLIKSEIAAFQVPFRGEPVQGLQIMGLLESRMLDFEHVYMLSVNEGKIPADASSNSLIPNDFRFEFNLPTYKDKDALFAYYFYRLLKRCSTATLFYSTQSEDFSNLEASRYIEQLRTELVAYNRQHRLLETHTALEPGLKFVREGKVVKTPEVMETIIHRLQTRGISPSAINKYLDSPLEYYLRYVAGIKERQEVEEDIEDSTFGDIVHKVLEDGYTEVKGRLLEEDVNRALKAMPDRLALTFDEKFKGPRETGRNRFKYEMARYQLERFYQEEQKHLKGRELHLIGLEESLSGLIRVGEVDVLINGTADRIEREGDLYRVVDYKSGSVDPSDVKVEDLSDLLAAKKKPKAFQLMLYAWLFMQKNKEVDEMEVANISISKLGSWYIPVHVNKSRLITRELVNEFEEVLKEILTEILNPKVVFENHEEVKYPLFK